MLAEVDNIRVGGELGFAAGDVGELDNIRLSETPSSTSIGCGPPPDSDGDFTPDEFDACPTEYGAANLLGCPPPAVPPPTLDPACAKAQEKLAAAKDKLKDAEGKRAKEKARAKVKKAKEKLKKACV